MKGKWRYRIMIFTLVALCGCYVGFNFFMTPKADAADVPVSGPQAQDKLEPDVGEELPPTVTKKVPTKPIELINYALQLYSEGAGSSSNFTMTVSNNGKLPAEYGGMSASVTQYAKGRTVRSGSQNLEETYFYYGGTSGLVEKLLLDNNLINLGYRAINVDEASDKVTYVQTKNVNISSSSIDSWTHDLNDASASKQEMTVSQAVDNFKVIYSMNFPLAISDSTVHVTLNDYLSNPKYTTITVQYNLDKLPSTLNDYYKANSSLRTVKYASYSYTFKINKKTGVLVELTRDEDFQSDALGGKLIIYSHTHFVQTFTSMNKQQSVPEPYLEYNK